MPKVTQLLIEEARAGIQARPAQVLGVRCAGQHLLLLPRARLACTLHPRHAEMPRAPSSCRSHNSWLSHKRDPLPVRRPDSPLCSLRVLFPLQNAAGAALPDHPLGLASRAACRRPDASWDSLCCAFTPLLRGLPHLPARRRAAAGQRTFPARGDISWHLVGTRRASAELVS